MKRYMGIDVYVNKENTWLLLRVWKSELKREVVHSSSIYHFLKG